MTGLTASMRPRNDRPGKALKRRSTSRPATTLPTSLSRTLALTLMRLMSTRVKSSRPGSIRSLGESLTSVTTPAKGARMRVFSRVEPGDLDVDLGLGQALGGGLDLVLLAARFDQGQLERGLGLLEVGLGGDPGLEALGGAVVIGLGPGDLIGDGLGGGLLGDRELPVEEELGEIAQALGLEPLQVEAVFAVVELDEEVAFADVTALGGGEVLDGPADLGLHGDALFRVGLAGRFEGHDQVAEEGLVDLDREGGGFDLLVGRGFGGGRRGGGGSGLAGGLGRAFIEDEEIDAGGDQDQDQESAQDGLRNAHQPPPCQTAHARCRLREALLSRILPPDARRRQPATRRTSAGPLIGQDSRRAGKFPRPLK